MGRPDTGPPERAAESPVCEAGINLASCLLVPFLSLSPLSIAKPGQLQWLLDTREGLRSMLSQGRDKGVEEESLNF